MKAPRDSLDGGITIIRKGLAIYKRHSSPYYLARLRDSKSGRYVVRSTKETSKIEARRAAEEWAQSLLSKDAPIQRQYTFE